jgi:hypothetical protein
LAVTIDSDKPAESVTTMARITVDEAKDSLTSLFRMLSGEDGDVLLGDLKKLLRGDFRTKSPRINQPHFATWKTIEVSPQQSSSEINLNLKVHGFGVSDRAANALSQCSILATEMTVDLVIVAVRDLGFEDAANRHEIYRRAKEFGLDLLPAEVVPHLRLRYQDQPQGQCLLVGMEPITCSDGDEYVFTLTRYSAGRSGGSDLLWLETDIGDSDNYWNPAYMWIFRRAKQ